MDMSSNDGFLNLNSLTTTQRESSFIFLSIGTRLTLRCLCHSARMVDQLNSKMDAELNRVMNGFLSPDSLPALEIATVFDILVYLKGSEEIPDGWDATHSHAVEDGEQDTLKGLNAPRHKVELSVAYRDES